MYNNNYRSNNRGEIKMEYTTVEENGMLRIVAIKDFGNIKAGDRGELKYGYE